MAHLYLHKLISQDGEVDQSVPFFTLFFFLHLLRLTEM